ncbi:MAG: glutamate--cysteine ligase [Chlamydiales bacterium]|jgi:glutamate--cysteine ligase
MDWNFQDITRVCRDSGAYKFLKKSGHGLEKECLRADSDGRLSRKPHPTEWGEKLTHPYISTDYSEAQPELITPYFEREETAYKFLQDVHLFLYQGIGDELLWPCSAPCLLPKSDEIPLADFGNSNVGIEKKIYRRGLGHRYGRIMQTMSGIHYNFSFAKEFLEFLRQEYSPESSAKDFASATYLKLIRNFLRIGWLNTYLFGATPVVDKTYLPKSPGPLAEWDENSYFGEYATSIRMSDLGYYSKVQAQISVSYSDVDSYIKDLTKLVTTPCPQFEKLGLFRDGQQLQLNKNFLQNEAEHYSRIRPKAGFQVGLTTRDLLRDLGIVYVEMRSVDINPFVRGGIGVDHLLFLHTFMVYCMLKESPPISKAEEELITTNQNEVALYGRKPKLRLNRFRKGNVAMTEWAEEILEEMQEVAKLLDENHSDKKYSKSLSAKAKKLHSPELMPSARVLAAMEGGKKSFRTFGLELAEKYKEAFLQKEISPQLMKKFTKLREKSIEDEKFLEIQDDYVLRGYEDMELSTQMIIREALSRGLSVEILDRKDNFIILKNGRHSEYIKQATFTTRDSYMSYLLMENKAVTKHLLEEKGIKVPPGRVYTEAQQAIDDYPKFINQKVVVKPNFTNYGIGVCFVSSEDQKNYEESVRVAFTHGGEIIVEEFFEGNEYRFLVVGTKVAAICQRVAAHVVGDGKSSVRKLIKLKNENPENPKQPQYYIQTGKDERQILEEQGMDFKSVPEVDQIVFLRKNSNVSTGGDPNDMTDDVAEEYSAIAVKSAQAASATFCGVDMMIQDITRKPDSNNHVTIELNFNPALHLHRYPAKGQKRYVEKAVLDELGF